VFCVVLFRSIGATHSMGDFHPARPSADAEVRKEKRPARRKAHRWIPQQLESSEEIQS
jgi:hypothetical protein